MHLIKHYADWCAPCKALSRVMEGIPYQDNDVESADGGVLAKEHGVRSLPTLALVGDDGNLVAKMVGLRTRAEIEEWLKENGATNLA